MRKNIEFYNTSMYEWYHILSAFINLSRFM